MSTTSTPEPKAAAHPRNYLELLHKTPVNTVCPNFFILDHAHGCTFDCSYCFLKDSEYGFKANAVFPGHEELYRQLSEWIARDDLETFLANAGNVADSLAFEKTRPMWGNLIEFMRENAEKAGKPHTLLVVTKAGVEQCEAFFAHAPCRNIIVSFSVNAPDAAREHEKGTATPQERLEAAGKLREHGWRVRIRLDPMIIGYDYGWVIGAIRDLAPERVTLGTLRADPTLMPIVGDQAIFQRLEEPEPGSIWRYPYADRMTLYTQAADRLRDVTSLGLCEEMPDVWDALGFDRGNKTCNCNPL